MDGACRETPAGLVAALLLLAATCASCGRNFDPQAFRAADDLERLDMARDFVEHWYPTQLDEASLVELLGPPSIDDGPSSSWQCRAEEEAVQPGEGWYSQPYLNIEFECGIAKRAYSNVLADALPRGTAGSLDDWRSSRPGARAALLPAILEQQILAGLSRGDVHACLGEPDMLWPRELLWRVGRGLCDDWWLVVQIDDGGRVMDACVVLL